MSPPEALLWSRLRDRSSGVRFRRQHPVGPYVVDFCCLAARLIVEVEGDVHNRAERAASDQRRFSFLHEQGFRVLRVAARRVWNRPDETAAAIVTLAAAPLHQPAAGPPPRAGEEPE